MINVAIPMVSLVMEFEHNSGVDAVPIVILKMYADPVVSREIGSIKRVTRIGRRILLHKPIRVIGNPGRVNTHVIRHHVACQANATLPRTIAQVCQGPPATNVLCNDIVKERISTGYGLVVTHHALD